MKKTPPKYVITLMELIVRGPAGMNELEALSAYGDTSLHSTISTLCNSKGFQFARKLEPHRHRGGGTTRFMRYTLIDREKAQRLVDFYCGSNAA